MSDEYCAALLRQRDELRETLIVITEKKLRFASPADIPSQLLKDERYWKRELAEIEREIEKHCDAPRREAEAARIVSNSQWVSCTMSSIGSISIRDLKMERFGEKLRLLRKHKKI